MKTIRSEKKLYAYLLKILANKSPKLSLNPRFVDFVHIIAERGGWLDKSNDIDGFNESVDSGADEITASCPYLILLLLTKGKRQSEVSEGLVRFVMRIIETAIEDGSTGYYFTLPTMIHFLGFDKNGYMLVSDEGPLKVHGTSKFEKEYHVRVCVESKKQSRIAQGPNAINVA